jgi:putative hydrolase of the HAD superfamily
MNGGEDTPDDGRPIPSGAGPTHHASFGIPPSVRAVLFDAVGTIIWPEPSVAGAYSAIGLRHGVELSEAEISQRFRAALARQDDLDRTRYLGRTSQDREIDRWRGIVADVFEQSPRAEQIFDDLWQHFAQPDHWRLFDDVAVTWRRLSDAGHLLGVASNFDDRLDGICQALPPLARCRYRFVSSRVGWRKPTPDFFAAIAAQLDLAPEQMLLVGDDLENDYLAARAAGWHAVLVDRRAQAPSAGASGGEASTVATIATLASLTAL